MIFDKFLFTAVAIITMWMGLFFVSSFAVIVLFIYGIYDEREIKQLSGGKK
jgi:hypothetical protein